MSQNQDEIPEDDYSPQDIERLIVEKNHLLYVAGLHQKTVQIKLMQVMRERAAKERIVRAIPPEMVDSEGARRIRDSLTILRVTEAELIREESEATRQKYEAFGEFERAVARRSAAGAWVPPPEFGQDVQIEDRQTMNHVLEATQQGQELAIIAKEKETKLQQAERIYEEIKQRIHGYLQNGAEGDAIKEIIGNFRRLRATLNTRESDYKATKAKALEAFKIAMEFKKRLNPEDQKMVGRELALLIAPPRPRVGAPVPSGAQRNIQVEIATKKDIDEMFNVFREISHIIRILQQDRTVAQANLQIATRAQNVQGVVQYQEAIRNLDARLISFLRNRRQIVDLWTTNLKAILNHKSGLSESYVKYLQDKIATLEKTSKSDGILFNECS